LQGLELAAFSSRLPHDKMTNEEVNLFPDIIDEDSTMSDNYQIESYKTFLFIRNKIVSFYLQINTVKTWLIPILRSKKEK
jgi:lysine-specific histone demethylase 1